MYISLRNGVLAAMPAAKAPTTNALLTGVIIRRILHKQQSQAIM
jgi:hypothetical protein